MEKIFYSENHFWISVDENIATVGITENILDTFSIVNSIDLPNISVICSQTELIGNIIYDENRTLELFAPVSGEIISSNELLIDNPEQLLNFDKNINWLFKIALSNETELQAFMTEEEYENYINGDDK